jgi:hypothetical protein
VSSGNQNLKMAIEDFGARVASVWQGLSSSSRNLIVGALQSATPSSQPSRRALKTHYDARADWELSRLLTALDERASENGSKLKPEQDRELRRMADTTAEVLQAQTRSAEVFTQLASRAHTRNDFARIDALADALSERFTPGEMCELAREINPVVRALAIEALAQVPIGSLVPLLVDPVDGEVARDALERQAYEFESEEARQVLAALEQVNIDLEI